MANRATGLPDEPNESKDCNLEPAASLYLQCRFLIAGLFSFVSCLVDPTAR